MPLGKRQRKILLTLGVFAAVIVLLLVSLPLWFPWVLRPLARWQGADFKGYEREGYSRFALTGFSFTNDTIRLRAERVEAFFPSVWMWKVLRSAKSEGVQPEFVRARNCELELLPSNSTNGSVYSAAQGVHSTLTMLKRWVPKAVVTAGRIRSGDTLVVLPQASWGEEQLAGTVELPQQKFSATVKIQGSGLQRYFAQIDSAQLGLHSDIDIATNGIGLALQATNTWLTNRFELDAQFERSGGLPIRANLTAQDLRIPSRLLKLSGYQDVTGTLSAKWENGGFGLDVTAGAQPVALASNLPPLKLDFHAFGDTNAVTLESAMISTPWLRASLSEHLKLYFTGQLLREHARLNLAVDLARQSWVPLEGTLTGDADFGPASGEIPEGRFHLTGAGIGSSRIKAERLNLDGHLNWPWLEVGELAASFDDGSKGSIRGRLELERQDIQNGQLSFQGPLFRRWLPRGYTFQDFAVSAKVRGPITNLVHAGHLEVANFATPELRPAQLLADWTGRRDDLEHAEVKVNSGNSSLQASGSLSNAPGKMELRLDSLSLMTNRQPVLTLEMPWWVSFARSGSNQVYEVQGVALDLAGTSGRLHLEGGVIWPRQGTLHLSAQNLSPAVLSGFIKVGVPSMEVRNLQAWAGWTNGPARFGLELSVLGALTGEAVAGAGATQEETLAALDRERQEALASEGGRSLAAQGPILLQLNARGDEKGIVVSNLMVSSQASEVATAQGFLPVVLNPSEGTNFLRIDRHEALAFNATTRPEAFFWQKVGALTGVSLREPNLDVKVTGTWEAPQGEVSLRAAEIQLLKSQTPMPSLRDLNVAMRFERERAQLVLGRILVQDQPVTLTGELPLGRSFWDELRERKLPNWESASAHLRIEHAKLAAAAKLLPSFLTPEGELEADLSLLAGGKFDGTLAIHQARTHPLATLGSLRHIEVELRAHERRVVLEQAAVDVGGSIVTLGGGMDLGGTAWRKEGVPPFQITVYGTNVPLSRQPESIIRSDLQLAVTKTNGAPPIVTGVARLRDSYYLSDLSDLIPGKVATPQRRPPYFSVEDPVLEDWRLAVRVQGPDFLRVRSSLFNGQMSANLGLQGTLKEPIALGDLKIDSGFVRFPFASLAVQQGFVTLTSENPYRPVLSVIAGSKQFGYNIRMEASGPIDAPILQFTSTPPLNSEQILLMVTAGQLPAGEFAMTSQQRAQSVAVFLGRDLLSKFGIEDQAEQRLTIKSGEELTEQGRPTYEVEFKLTERWSVVGEYDRFGDYNGGLKWRVYSK